jgi:preprotein translocase subunit SecE
VNTLVKTGIVVALIAGAFVYLWLKGHLTAVSNYTRQTWDELHKCSWPTWDELKGSTLVVAISLALLGGFTVGVDVIFSAVFSKL